MSIVGSISTFQNPINGQEYELAPQGVIEYDSTFNNNVRIETQYKKPHIWVSKYNNDLTYGLTFHICDQSRNNLILERKIVITQPLSASDAITLSVQDQNSNTLASVSLPANNFRPPERNTPYVPSN